MRQGEPRPTEPPPRYVWLVSHPPELESDSRRPLRFCWGVCSGVGRKPGSSSPDFTHPLGMTNRGRSPPPCRVTLSTEPPISAPLFSRPLSRRWMEDWEALPLRRLVGLWAMIQQTARPESAAPMVKADTADATSRLRETKLSGSISKLCCRIPKD
ncbi:hypothetical protein EYF80_011642 [Liparis tanakae]|uniref:Uncharacterized protein n=1 Tax=Liparis tanakae TaxID=230148 RepID=A0A4Z2IK17_9TELE|nr:hypothetical protein EYF80_011642 [Liparis tanakae]